MLCYIPITDMKHNFVVCTIYVVYSPLKEIIPQRRHLTVEEAAEVIEKFTTRCS